MATKKTPAKMAGKKVHSNSKSKKRKTREPRLIGKFKAVSNLDMITQFLAKGMTELNANKIMMAVIRTRPEKKRKTFAYQVIDLTLGKHNRQLVGKRYSK